MAQAENENSNSHGFHGDATKTFHFGGISDNPQNGKSLGMVYAVRFTTLWHLSHYFYGPWLFHHTLRRGLRWWNNKDHLATNSCGYACLDCPQVPSSSGVNKLGASCTMPRCRQAARRVLHAIGTWSQGLEMGEFWFSIIMYYSYYCIANLLRKRTWGVLGATLKPAMKVLQSNMETMRPAALGI